MNSRTSRRFLMRSRAFEKQLPRPIQLPLARLPSSGNKSLFLKFFFTGEKWARPKHLTRCHLRNSISIIALHVALRITRSTTFFFFHLALTILFTWSLSLRNYAERGYQGICLFDGSLYYRHSITVPSEKQRSKGFEEEPARNLWKLQKIRFLVDDKSVTSFSRDSHDSLEESTTHVYRLSLCIFTLFGEKKP